MVNNRESIRKQERQIGDVSQSKRYKMTAASVKVNSSRGEEKQALYFFEVRTNRISMD